jgi:hypothetical protein
VKWGTVELVTALIICEPFLMMPACSTSRPTTNPVRFCRNRSGTSIWLQSWMKWAAFSADSGSSTPLLPRTPIGYPWIPAHPHTSVLP